MINTNDFYFEDHLSNSPVSLFIAAQFLHLKAYELCCLLCENSVVFVPNGKEVLGYAVGAEDEQHPQCCHENRCKRFDLLLGGRL